MTCPELHKTYNNETINKKTKRWSTNKLCPVNNLNSVTAGARGESEIQSASHSEELGLWKTFGEYPYLFLPRGPPSHFPKDYNGIPPTEIPFFVASCSSGLGNLVFIDYLPGSEKQKLNPIKLQPYQEGINGQKAAEGLNGWLQLHCQSGSTNSRTREAPIEAKALGPVGPCLKTSLATRHLFVGAAAGSKVRDSH
ncbi:hypothetical protein TNCV_2161521 [Trichonephila clavipes]|nr:hypothetical protein TNCV_2161521 [Trichonephila clavipes]